MRDGIQTVLAVTRRIRVPLSEFSFQFARSSGAGGQNVNKVNSKALLRWSVVSSPSLPEGVRQRFCARFHHRLTQDGELLLQSQRFRDQGRNVSDCLEKLRAMLAEVAVAPKTRKATRPSRSAREKRMTQKRSRAHTKRQRERVRSDD